MAELVVVNLKVISRIPPRCKISQKNGVITFSKNKYFQSISRLISGDSRGSSLKLIYDTIESIIFICNSAIESKLFNSNSDILSTEPFIYNKILREKQKTISKLNNLHTDLKLSTNGLVNLKDTYGSDNATVSKLDILIDKITYNTSCISNFLKKHELICSE